MLYFWCLIFVRAGITADKDNSVIQKRDSGSSGDKAAARDSSAGGSYVKVLAGAGIVVIAISL